MGARHALRHVIVRCPHAGERRSALRVANCNLPAITAGRAGQNKDSTPGAPVEESRAGQASEGSDPHGITFPDGPAPVQLRGYDFHCRAVRLSCDRLRSRRQPAGKKRFVRSGGFTNHHCAVRAAHGEARAVRTERQRIRRSLCGVAEQGVAVHHFPQTEILRARCDSPAVRRPCDGPHLAGERIK